MTLHADPIAYPPRGLSREEAARYVGVSPATFDQMVAERTMPRPRRYRKRVIWDRVSLDLAFQNLDGGDEPTGNVIDHALARE